MYVALKVIHSTVAIKTTTKRTITLFDWANSQLQNTIFQQSSIISCAFSPVKSKSLHYLQSNLCMMNAGYWKQCLVGEASRGNFFYLFSDFSLLFCLTSKNFYVNQMERKKKKCFQQWKIFLKCSSTFFFLHHLKCSLAYLWIGRAKELNIG